MKLVVIALFLVFAHVHSAPSSKEKIIALRDALNKIIKENEIQVKPCTYHSCKPEMFVDCTALKLDANGCELCECDRGTPAACPRHNCNAENMNCGEAGIKVDEKGCPMCECNHIVIESRAAEEPINKGACMLLPEVGPCRGKVERFYFHRGENICKKFFYGGCGGNDNNFETREKCSATCGAKSKFNVVYDDQPAPCPMHLCSAESMDCPTGKLAKNEHGCDLCECEVIVEPEPEEPVACPLHACTAEMLGCANGLATIENGCELCECQGVTEPEGPVACPYHACTAEMLGCANGLATMENGCELCECQVVEPEGPVACHYHACTAEMLGCEFGLAVDANGCALCECQENEEPEPQKELSKCEQQREDALAFAVKVADGPMIPGCEEDGSYQSIQCYYDQCWCVEPSSGKEIAGTRTNIKNLETMKCDGKVPEKVVPESENEKETTELEKRSQSNEIEALIEALQKRGIN